MRSARDLLTAAMALPEDEREQLAAALLDSIEPSPHGLSIDDTAEIERRANEARASAPGVPWDEVKRRLRG
jgi:putative addiction module component (TIGR02574 family)